MKIQTNLYLKTFCKGRLPGIDLDLDKVDEREQTRIGYVVKGESAVLRREAKGRVSNEAGDRSR